MWWRSLFLSILVGYISAHDKDPKDSRIVKTTQGLVRGYKESNHGIYAFYSIPYATAPKGQHKFKGPLPPPVWLDTFEAVDKKIVCPQQSKASRGYDLFSDKLMQEDCLIANVYVPDTEENNLPVLVYVHGGAYVMGYGNLATPYYFVKTKKAIVVTFNYRLGAFGYLCLGTEDVPGNAGMKDQVALLRWVKQNIANFGGNADDVTIAGYSAGSMSVDLLMLSKMADGLFTKVIPESGSNLGSFAVQNDPIINAKKFAKRKGFENVDDFYALEDFYKNTPWENIVEEVVLPADATPVFAPCVERYTGVEMFLDDAPFNILKSGNYRKVPLLYGIANAEGLLQMPSFDEYSKQMNEDFASVLPGDLKFESIAQKEEVAKIVNEFYFKDKKVAFDTIPSYVDFFTDTYFSFSLTWAVKLHVAAGHKQIYVYEYSYVDKEQPSPLIMQIPQLKELNLGADHCAQTFAMLDGVVLNNDESKLSQKMIKMKAVVRDLWYNFIVTKQPIPEGSSLPAWPPAGADCGPHMSLNETLELRGALLADRMPLWESIYDRHYNPPSPPPTPPARHSEL